MSEHITDNAFIYFPREGGLAMDLTYGAKVCLYPADPEGSYVVRIIVPGGDDTAIGFSNEGLAALWVLIQEQVSAGLLEQGFSVLEKRQQEEGKL